MATPELEKHHRVESAAKLLDLSPHTIRKWIRIGDSTRGRRGIHPTRRMGSGIRLIPDSALRRWIAGASVAPLAAPKETP